MSTMKIKTEPAATAVDVKVKLEPSHSTGDIKLEKHTSDIDTKVESNSEADNEKVKEEYIRSESDDDSDGDIDEDTDQSQDTVAPSIQRQYICEYNRCGRKFYYGSNLRMHQHEHRLQTELSVFGKIYTLVRQSLNDRWSCPIPGCKITTKTADGTRCHIRACHVITIKQQQHQQPPTQMTRLKQYFLDVDSFYVNGIRCGYHITTGVFICHNCRLVPERLLTHLQQKHGFDEKLIDDSTLPETAVNGSADPNINQHVSNLHLASAIRNPYQWHHQNILQGWLCVTTDCGYCGSSTKKKNDHRRYFHQSEQITTVRSLVLRLNSSKLHTSCFLITRIDQASGAVTTSSSRLNQHKLHYSNNGLDAQDENGDGADQNETTEGSNQKRQLKCDCPNCEHIFNSSKLLGSHRREHKLEVVVNVHGNTYTLTRQSLNDRWSCPVPDCETTCKTVDATQVHIRSAHRALLKQKRANIEDDDDLQQQQPIIKRRQRATYYLKVSDFRVNDVRCGYHHTTGVFICHECRLVPECLLTHLQQKHGYSEKSIENEFLPESTRITGGTDPNINQHTRNSHLAAAISQPSQLHHPDIVQGWMCITSDCGYCYSTTVSRNRHQYIDHKGEQLLTVPALMLRLLYAKTCTSYFLITRLDASTNNVNASDSISQNNSQCDNEDDIEVDISDISDEDDIHKSQTATSSTEPPKQPQLPSQYNMFNMPLPDDPEFWRLLNNS